MCAGAWVGQTHTIHFRTFQQEIFARGGGGGKRLLLRAANRLVALRAVHNSHGRGNGEARRRKGAGNLIQNLLQSLGQGFHQITFP